MEFKKKPWIRLTPAADGEQSDIFYNDGVNWPAGNGSAAHDCFAGYEGSIGGFTGNSQS